MIGPNRTKIINRTNSRVGLGQKKAQNHYKYNEKKQQFLVNRIHGDQAFAP